MASSVGLRAKVAFVLATGIGGCVASLHCGASTPVASPDAGLGPRDGSVVPDARGAEDAGADVPEADAYLGSVGACPVDPGWHVVPVEGPACTLLAPDDVAKDLPTPKWVPCTNGQAGCDELDLGGDRPITQISASLLGRALGPPQLEIEWGTRTSSDYGTCVRIAVVDFLGRDKASVRAAWDTTNVAPDGVCSTEFIKTTGEWAMMFRRNASTSMALGQRVSMQKIVAVPHPEDGHDAFGSPTVLATRNMTGGLVYRMPFGSNQAKTVPTPPGVSPMFLELVEGNDVFARSNYGTGTFSQWYRVDADGQARLALSNPNAHIAGLRSDGSHLFWIEASGNPNMIWPQPKMEVWSSPYVQDLSAIRATARKLADVSGVLSFAEEPSASNGYYMYAARAANIVVVRESDGAVQTVSAGAGRVGYQPLYATNSEVWLVYGKANAEAAIERIKLELWPP